jgi:ABC-type xylose transport system permease subunit
MENLTLKERIKAKSPKLFKKITNGCVAIGVVGGAIMAVASGGILLPAYIVTLSGYMVTIGVVGGAVSKITVEDAKDVE